MIFLPPLLFFAAFQSSWRDLRADARDHAHLHRTRARDDVRGRRDRPRGDRRDAVGDGFALERSSHRPTRSRRRRSCGASACRAGCHGRGGREPGQRRLRADRVPRVAAAVVERSRSARRRSTCRRGGGGGGGLAAGWVIGEVRRRIEDPPVEITISLLTGYAAYVPAEARSLGRAGGVAAGLYIGRLSPRSARRGCASRVLGVGRARVPAQRDPLPADRPPAQHDPRRARGYSTGELLGYAALISGTVIAMRFAWTFTIPYVIRALDRRPSQRARRVGAPLRIVVAWSGMRARSPSPRRWRFARDRRRGAAAAARADPVPHLRGDPRHARAPGAHLAGLIRALRIRDDGADREQEELHARLVAATAALAALDNL